MPQVSIPQSDTQPLIDTSQMDEANRAFVEMFERERGGGQSQVDDATLTSAEDEAETPGTPGPTADSTAAPESPTTLEGESGGSESAPSEVEPPTTPTTTTTTTVVPDPDDTVATPVEGEPTEPGAAQPDPAFTFAGVDYTSTDLAQAVQLRGWYQSLNTPQIQAIDALLSGEYQLVPTNPSQPVVPTQVQSTPPASSVPPDNPPVVDDDAGEWLDPRAQQEINRLRTELNQVKEQFTTSVTPLVQTQQSQQLDATLAAIDQASAAFKDKYTLADEDLKSINDAFVQSGIFPSLVQRHNGNVLAATSAGLEMMMWTTPTFQDKIVNDRVTALSTDDQARVQQDKAKKLTSLASTGGSVPRRTTTPQTKDERYAAMVEDIRSAQSNGSI